jgi:hypothetical protein
MHGSAVRRYDIVQAVLSKSQSPLVRKIGPKTKQTHKQTNTQKDNPAEA